MNNYRVIKTYDDKRAFVLSSFKTLSGAKDFIRSEWLWILSEAKSSHDIGSISDDYDRIQHENYTITIKKI